MMRLKNINKFLSKTFLALGAGAILFSACNDDENAAEPNMPTGMLTVSDQTLSQNKVMVSNINLDQKGWVVVHASTAEGGPLVPDIISEPLLVEAGSTDNLEVELTNVEGLSDGDKLWVMLHTDDGTEGSYEFDGVNGLDAPLTTEDGDIIMSEITVSAASVSVDNQVVSENKVIISEVNAAVDGWIVIHSGEAGGPVIGQTMVMSGSNTDVEVDLGDKVFAGEEMLFAMLHIESPADGEYGFPDNGDGPEVFGADVVVVGFETIAPSGSIVANNQPISNNTITISDLTVDATAWVVVHASNATNDGPEVPGIISTPVQLQAGTNSNVEIMLNESHIINGGDVLYVMLHTENGVIGEYEFDGANGFDGPIVAEAITIEAPTGSITANDQIVQGNTITVSDLTVNAAAWVVVHASNATNNGPEVPGIISTPVKLEAGSNSDVEIMINESNPLNAGDVIYIMLHTENGTIGEYEFDGANRFDGPITTQAITVQAPTGSFVANDQTLTAGKLIVESVTVGQPSWVVVHRDNGNGSFVAPGIISEPVSLNAGTTSDVEVTFTEEVTDGETLWVMLHNDNGVVGTYEFDGANGLDNPINFSSLVVSTTTSYDVVNNGTSAYLFSGNGLNEASNSDITLTRGETYTFTINASGHPFYIKTVQSTGTTDAYNDGVTNNGTQTGTVTFTVPADAPNTLFYNCEFHSSMTGTFTIID